MDNNKPLLICYTNQRTWEPILDMFKGLYRLQAVGEITKDDVVLFEGGTDISTNLYGEPNIWAGEPDPVRDQIETQMFRQASKVGAKMLGICRGSQFLTAMNGGRLVQDVDNHTAWHLMDTVDRKQMLVSSTHHQMMNPFNLPKEDYQILGWAATRRGTRYKTGVDGVWYTEPGHASGDIGNHMPKEPEIVWYPKTNSLAIQGHPEYMDNYKEDAFVKYTRLLVKRYLLPQQPNPF